MLTKTGNSILKDVRTVFLAVSIHYLVVRLLIHLKHWNKAMFRLVVVVKLKICMGMMGRGWTLIEIHYDPLLAPTA